MTISGATLDTGTEPLLRVMVEGKNHDEITAWAQEIVDVVKEHLG